MNKYLSLLSVGLVLVSACSTDPVSVVEEFQDAVNSQNIEAATPPLAEDAVLQVDEVITRTGKAEIENWLEMQADLRHRVEGNPTSSESGVSIENCSISSGMWLFFETNPMTGTCDVVLEGGLIISFTVRFDEDSTARLSGSPAATTADLIGVWTTNNYLADSGDLFLEILDSGTGRLVGSPDNSLPAPDSDFEGASIAWTYEDYVLTIQNEGSASEPYCQEQDVGVYLVKSVDAGGLKFKPISDSCGLRKVAFELPPRWRPQAP